MKALLKMTIVFAIIVFASCNKENCDYKSKGTIIGLDRGACMCCGGWIIKIDKQQYLFNSLPDSTINLKTEKFPLQVRLDWKLVTDGCPNTIIIERIKKY